MTVVRQLELSMIRLMKKDMCSLSADSYTHELSANTCVFGGRIICPDSCPFSDSAGNPQEEGKVLRTLKSSQFTRYGELFCSTGSEYKISAVSLAEM